MKLKNYILAAALTVANANAASIIVATTGDGGTIAGGTAKGIYDTLGVAIPFGTGFTAVGSFTNVIPNFSASTGTQVGDAFTTLGSTGSFGFTLGATDVNGLFSINGSSSIVSGNPLIGETIFFVGGNGSSFATSTQLIVIDFGSTFAVDNPAFNASFNLQAGDGSVTFGSDTFNGSSSPLVQTFNGSPESYQMSNLVPEPSAALLGAIGALGLLRRRRN